MGGLRSTGRGGGGREDALLRELVCGSGDNWAAREETAALPGGPAAPAARFLPHRGSRRTAGGGALAFWAEGARWN